ncbi:hypothetical protein CHS0354_015815 [Potamilus streckersoni]|uniref:Uncharacterized protein n=1 Tax=Potamilus streckersoni TaxID=2493646 RepID=A0AAE0SDA4_9BIVA|nr:hypothetical protein CHS0354_015815 [Potamilus streckersoni]
MATQAKVPKTEGKNNHENADDQAVKMIERAFARLFGSRKLFRIEICDVTFSSTCMSLLPVYIGDHL